MSQPRWEQTDFFNEVDEANPREEVTITFQISIPAEEVEGEKIDSINFVGARSRLLHWLTYYRPTVFFKSWRIKE